MITGWKRDPKWRMYYEMKEQTRRLRQKAARDHAEQMKALDDAAHQILEHVAAAARHKNITLH